MHMHTGRLPVLCLCCVARRSASAIRPAVSRAHFFQPTPPRHPFLFQVRKIQASGLLLLGWAARGKGGGASLPAELVERCLDLVVTAEKLHSMDVAIKSHSSWARSNLQLARFGAMVVYSGASTSEDTWADTAPLDAEEGGGLVTV